MLGLGSGACILSSSLHALLARPRPRPVSEAGGRAEISDSRPADYAARQPLRLGGLM